MDSALDEAGSSPDNHAVPDSWRIKACASRQRLERFQNVSPLAHLFTALVKSYRALLSPLFPGVCRYVPTCSQYMLEAIDVHGAVKGFWLGLRRILSCHPVGFLGGGSGLDPVPRHDHTGPTRHPKESN